MNDDFSYFEPTEALKVRIEAHKKYSEFSLEEYLSKTFDMEGKRILDLGSGNGNLTSCLSNNAELYIGVEKNSESIKQAYQCFRGNEKVCFIEQDMDSQLYLPDSTFHFIFAIFSAYYSNNPESLFQFCKNCLKEDGTLVLIGPTENNSWEVDDFCFQLYGQAPTSKERANRLESEFAPLLKSLGLLIVSDRINFDLTFPDSDQYLKYLTSTLQFRLSYNGSLDREVSKNIIAEKYNKTLTKEIVCLRAKRI